MLLKKSSEMVTLLFLTVSYSTTFHYFLLENPGLLSEARSRHPKEKSTDS